MSEGFAIGLDSNEERVQIINQDGEHVCYVERYPLVWYARLIEKAPEMYALIKGIASTNTEELGPLEQIEFLKQLESDCAEICHYIGEKEQYK